MKLVILESYVMEPGDLDWSGLRALVPDTVEYVRTPYEEIARRIGDAELVVLNKCRVDEAILAQCPNLRWVGIIATGTDNLDLAACRRHGVKVANVPAYSTYSVAQMAFSLLLTVCHCPFVHQGAPGGVEQDGPRLHPGQGLRPDQPPGGGGGRAVEADHVAFGQQGIQRDELHPVAGVLRPAGAGPGQHPHPERLRQPRGLPPDVAVPADAEGLAVQLHLGQDAVLCRDSPSGPAGPGCR